MQKKLPKVYLFIDSFNPINLDGLNKNISIIYRNYKKKVDESTIISLKNYCRLNKREFFLTANIKLAIKTLVEITDDSETTDTLRRRVAQLRISLGSDPNN